MPGGPAQSTERLHQSQAQPAAEWYVVTTDGGSALRIAPGLAVGETETGALALNDPDPVNQWVQFDLRDGGRPSVAVVTRDKSLLVDGQPQMRYAIAAGTVLRLPNNTLHISRDFAVPRGSGSVLEVVPRDVPGRAEDLVGPGWDEALDAVRQSDAPSPGVSLETLRDLQPVSPAVVQTAATPARPPRDGAMPATEARRPSRGRHGRRRRQQRRRLAVASTVLAVVLAAAGAAFYAIERGGVDWQSTVAAWRGILPSGGSAPPQPADSATAPSSTIEPSAVDESNRPSSARPVESPDAPAPVGNAAAAVPPRAEGQAPASDRASVTGQAPAADQATNPPSVTGRSPAATPAADEPPPAGASPASDVPGGPVPAGGGDETPTADTARVPGDSETAAPSQSAPSTVPDWRLSRAQQLLDDGYITFPPEDNAVRYLKQVLADDPTNTEALRLLQQCTGRLIDAATRAHDGGLDYEARNTLEEVFGFDPDNRRAGKLWRQWVGSSR